MECAKAHHGIVQSSTVGGSSPFSKEVVEKLERQWSDTRKEIEEVLTPEQLRTLKDLTFRTFAFGSGVMFEPEVLGKARRGRRTSKTNCGPWKPSYRRKKTAGFAA